MKVCKILLWIFISTMILLLSTYLFIIPICISNYNVVNLICDKISKNAQLLISVKNPILKTYLNSNIEFKADEINVSKDNVPILTIKALDTQFSLKSILKKKIYINKFSLDSIQVDADKLTSLSQNKDKNEQKPFDWSFDLYDSILVLNNVHIKHSPSPKVYLTLDASNICIDNTQKDFRYIHFNFDTIIKTENKQHKFAITDRNQVYIKQKHIYFDNCIFEVNKSKVAINIDGSRKNGLKINLKSKNFSVEDIADIISTNLIISNGNEILSYINNLNGELDFDISFNKNQLNGSINLHNANMQVIPLNNLAFKINKCLIQLTPKNITLRDFDGYYGINTYNKVFLEGVVNDYAKTCNTELTIKTVVNNEFAQNTLSQMTGVPIEITGNAGTKIVIKSVQDMFKITAMSKISKGEDILVDGVSLTPTDYDRAIKADMLLQNNLLKIENLNYYIASELKKGVKVQPVVVLKGKVDISKSVPKILALGLEVPNSLPSEFLNVFIAKRLFKGGDFCGKLYYLNEDNEATMKGYLKSNNIRIPSQRLFLKKADLYTDNDSIHIISNGRYKRSSFVFTGEIRNRITFPIVIKKVDFELDKLNMEKLLNSFNQKPQQLEIINESLNDDDDNDTSVTFDFNNLIIENCVFKLAKGSYKDILFGNLNARLTLNEKNILELTSNKFDIAEGTSTVTVVCDLNKHKYNLRLGIKDVNSDLISTVLLNLPREISGKASGLIELNTDDTLKMNGLIKFAIKDGQIQKIGLVEYLMKFVSIFRNPVAMISPSIIADIINIPEGKFEKINGELNIENNFVKLIKIKSSSPQLSTYIVGCYNIETSDAILRIYTKFSNKKQGFGGFLRNISLNSLANRIMQGSKSDINYYSAELQHLPEVIADEKDCQIFLTTVDGDLEHNNFLSSLKKIK